MIKFENTEVFNFEGAIRGMRNPLNSWDKSDSFRCSMSESCSDCQFCDPKYERMVGNDPYILGPNDLDLARRLINAGSDHRKFLRQIFISVDITAPLYWWKEFDTYKVATVANSCSTMHKIHSKPIELSDFSIDDFEVEEGHTLASDFEQVVIYCEWLRQKYLETKDRRYWRALIQLLPESYEQKRTITLTYETLRNMRGSRRNHKLSEWSVDFMEWLESLPYAEDLITS